MIGISDVSGHFGDRWHKLPHADKAELVLRCREVGADGNWDLVYQHLLCDRGRLPEDGPTPGSIEHLLADVVENERLRAVIVQIYHLHTDSVAGVCPSCGDIGAALSGLDDGLVAWPCPTVQAIQGVREVAS